MIKIAFWFDAPVEYAGGLNYIKNLLFALSLVNDGAVRPYVFFSADVPAEVEAQFSAHATVVRTRLLQRGTAQWLTNRILDRIFGTSFLVGRVLKAYQIGVLSHAWFVYKGRCPVPILGWIPDFQYLHLPELFPGLDSVQETERHQQLIAQSDIVILSSHNAFEDFSRIAPAEHRSRGRVLQFVSQPKAAEAGQAATRHALESKYQFSGKYFFLPNQFWAHKNHIVVLQAVKLLKDRGTQVLVVCTGNIRDYRIAGSDYIDGLYGFIDGNGLDAHVRILGHINYSDVLSLMRHSIAVLNPSRFEGWSSSVEEAKSMGKPVIVSHIAVHREQSPSNAHYFDPDDATGLAQIMEDAWSKWVEHSSDEAERAARDALHARTIGFGRAYLDILNSAVRRRKHKVSPVRSLGRKTSG